MDMIVGWLKSHWIEVAILIIVLFILMIVSRKESYIGGPLNSMTAWTSGGALRRGGQVFSSTDQQISEGMTGYRGGVPYVAPWVGTRNNSAASAVGSAGISPASTESFNGGRKIDADSLKSLIHS